MMSCFQLILESTIGSSCLGTVVLSDQGWTYSSGQTQTYLISLTQRSHYDQWRASAEKLKEKFILFKSRD